MIGPSARIFLEALGELCTSEGFQARVLLDVASDLYTVGMRDLSRTLYTVTTASGDFPNAKKGSILRVGGIDYEAVKPAIVKADTSVFVCVKV